MHCNLRKRKQSLKGEIKYLHVLLKVIINFTLDIKLHDYVILYFLKEKTIMRIKQICLRHVHVASSYTDGYCSLTIAHCIMEPNHESKTLAEIKS